MRIRSQCLWGGYTICGCFDTYLLPLSIYFLSTNGKIHNSLIVKRSSMRFAIVIDPQCMEYIYIVKLHSDEPMNEEGRHKHLSGMLLINRDLPEAFVEESPEITLQIYDVNT